MSSNRTRAAAMVGVLFCAMLCGRADGTNGDEETLRRQVDELSRELASARREIEDLRTRLTRLEFDRSAPLTLKPDGFSGAGEEAVSVLDANDELRMIAVNSGMRHGMKPGAVLAVIRDGEVIARVRVVDVRDMIAGAVILTNERGQFPEPGDGLVPAGWTESRG